MSCNHKTRFRVSWMFVALIVAGAAYAADSALDGLLQKYPANNAEEFNKINAELFQLGEAGLADLCGRLTPPQQGGDAQVRFAISGLTKFVKLQNDEANRKLVVRVLLDALNKAADNDVKQFLIEQIQIIAKEEAVAPLSRYLTDDRLSEPAAEALFAIKAPESSAALLFALPQVKDALKPAIVKTLGDLRSRAAALALVPFTESGDQNTRLMAYYAVANIGDLSAGNPLKKALTKTSGYEQSQAMSAYLRYAKRLAEAQADDAALEIYRTILTTYTSEDDVNIQCDALGGLVSLDKENALTELLKAVDSPYKEYRIFALKLALNVPGNKATWGWIEKSKKVAPDVRAEIIAFLGSRGDKIALPTLLEALNDADAAVKLAAIPASFQLGGLESVPFFTGLLRTEDAAVIGAVKDALLQVSGEYLLTTISYILSNVSTPAKVALFDVIAQRKADLFYPDALSYAEDQDASLRIAAIKALKDIVVADNIGDLMVLLGKVSGEDAEEVENAIYAIVEPMASNREKVDFLKEAAKEQSYDKKIHLIHLLGRIRGEEALATLIPALDCSELKEEAAAVAVKIICPQEGEAYGLRSNQAYCALEKAIPLLKDRELIDSAKKHLPAPLAAPDADGFIPLFNGQDMTGWVWSGSWEGKDGGYTVQDGVMTCDPQKAGNIYTDREFSDFIYRFEFKMMTKAANNGVGIRAPLYGDSAYSGMEIQILDHDDPEYSWIKPYQAHGSVYGTIPAERGYLKPVGEWNDEEIKIDGRWIQVTLNGHVITQGHLDAARMPNTLDHLDHPGLSRTSGHIGFLGHGYSLSFRNHRIKELNKEPRPDNVPPEGFTALFNGIDLTGWKGLVANPPERAKTTPEQLAEAQAKADESMRENWKVENGVLVFSGKGDNLCTAKDYGDFELLVDWKILEKGDSGIYLRGSPQVQIWDPKNFNLGSGGLYNNQKNPAGPLTFADNPVGEWNTFRIIMVGERVTVYLNDKLVVDNTVMENYWERDKPIYPTGAIELQNHGNTLYFKNIYVRELTK